MASSMGTKITTEDWYKSLPSGVKSYLSSVSSAIIATGEISPTSTPTTGGPSDSDSDPGSDSDSGSQTGAEGAASTGGAPAQLDTFAASVVGAAGVLGLVAAS